MCWLGLHKWGQWQGPRHSWGSHWTQQRRCIHCGIIRTRDIQGEDPDEANLCDLQALLSAVLHEVRELKRTLTPAMPSSNQGPPTLVA